MVVDSDDEAEMLPKAKRARTARGEVAIVVHADSSSRKRKRVSTCPRNGLSDQVTLTI